MPDPELKKAEPQVDKTQQRRSGDPGSSLVAPLLDPRKLGMDWASLERAIIQSAIKGGPSGPIGIPRPDRPQATCRPCHNAGGKPAE
jgi:hypothetical protein